MDDGERSGRDQLAMERQRVFAELKPDESQKAKLEQIFDDLRQKMAQLREMRKDGDRRKLAERLRAESRARVMEILSESQKPIYERLLAEFGGGRTGASAAGRLWVPGEDGQPRAVELRTGLTDGTSTELAEGTLKEGDSVILGIGEGPAATAAKKGGPTGPRMF